MFSEKVQFTVFLVAAAVLCFCAGVSVAVMKWPPYQLFQDTRDTAEQIIRGPWMRDTRYIPRKYEGQGVVVHDTDRAFEGVTIVQGHFENGSEIRAYAMDGTLLNSWPMDFWAVWPEPAHIIPQKNVPNSEYGFHTQGMVLEPDGSIVVNFAEKGTAKFGPCGDVLWTVDRMTHHSITRNPDGTYWIPTKLDPADIPEDQLLPKISVKKIMESDNYYADSALLISPDGAVLQEVPVLGPVLDWYKSRHLFDRIFEMDVDTVDPLHLNDIEVVTPALAAKIDDVEEGDLLLSLRNTHSLAVLNIESGTVTHMIHGPWIRQHDPDITEDGMIDVYDNGITHKVPGRDFQGTRIIRWDAGSDTPQTLYPVSEDETFFSWIMGTHQRLPNGNLLITESTGGRVFEVTPDGEIVWSLVLTSTEKTAALIEAADRVPLDFVDLSAWQCSGSAS